MPTVLFNRKNPKTLINHGEWEYFLDLGMETVLRLLTFFREQVNRKAIQLSQRKTTSDRMVILRNCWFVYEEQSRYLTILIGTIRDSSIDKLDFTVSSRETVD